ncbi:SCO2523 family variant P-loop protein [Nocardia sp. XZ_19_385]|uniref:SCO2523 family variant P-loop protein n=1 Tax=Nocardia sp. XZ_19_385 TaxID=2769488 RepID=UPI00188EAC56|nr:SCO2523 family variant P-loop protein [Nocardia sp. XZ_19_385]
MIVFATSDKGGTGRSVTSCNIGYRLSVQGRSVAYLDFDFGSPTAGALFEIGEVGQGVSENQGVHSYLLGDATSIRQVDVRVRTDRAELKKTRGKAGDLILFPGDEGGAELKAVDNDMVDRCVQLLLEVDHEFGVCIVDLSAGRSMAMELALRATARSQLLARTVRWLVFYRWTRQHILAANGLVHGQYGLLTSGKEVGHDKDRLLDNLRFVRTAVPDPSSIKSGTGAQAAWLHEQDVQLKRLSSTKIGADVLGETPVEPMLQWREQVVLDVDVRRQIASPAIVDAFTRLADQLIDPRAWAKI